MYGYAGKILRIDLTRRELRVEPLDPGLARKFIGGSGLGTYYLNAETGPETDPLGPENLLIMMTGPFAGTGLPTSGRFGVVTKSPLTGIYAEADVGGTFGLALKKSGYDGIIIKGKSDRPCYINLSGEKAEILEAEALWGKDTYECDEALKAIHGKNVTVACIGQAGENLVKIASIMTDGRDARAAGRCGVGAVMGSKNLKAVVAGGSFKPEVAKPAELKESIKHWFKFLAEQGKGMKDFGTAGGLEGNEYFGDLPIRNWRQGTWGRSEEINGEKMAATVLTGVFHCGNCPIGCGRKVKITSGEYAGVEGAGPEYETAGMLGSDCLVDDLEAICAASEACNRYGMDTISAGAVIAFAMEAYERGIITDKDTAGQKILWGDARAVLNLLEKIAYRRDVGDVLAEGVREAARRLGGIADEFAVHVKGLELPAHDPRAHNSLALSYATSNRGACHLAGFTHGYEKGMKMPEIGLHESQDRFATKDKGWMTAGLQNVMGMFDSLKLCKFTLGCGLTVTQVVEWVNMVTGWDMTVEEFIRTGERMYNLKRLYNVRHGISRKDDTLPPRIMQSKRKEGGAAEHLPHLGEMLSQYYEARGWDEFGIPTPETIKALDL